MAEPDSVIDFEYEGETYFSEPYIYILHLGHLADTFVQKDLQ